MASVVDILSCETRPADHAMPSPDSRLATSCGDDKTVRLWDVQTQDCLRTFFDHDESVGQARFHPDGTCVAACSADRTIKVWDARSHQLLQHYPAHDGEVTSISFHHSGNFLLSSSNDASLKIWDLREGRLIYTLKGHSGPVTACAFSADGTRFASGGEDGLVMSWRSHLDNRLAGGATGASTMSGAAAAVFDTGVDGGGAVPAAMKIGARRGGSGGGLMATPGRPQRTALGVRTTNTSASPPGRSGVPRRPGTSPPESGAAAVAAARRRQRTAAYSPGDGGGGRGSASCLGTATAVKGSLGPAPGHPRDADLYLRHHHRAAAPTGQGGGGVAPGEAAHPFPQQEQQQHDHHQRQRRSRFGVEDLDDAAGDTTIATVAGRERDAYFLDRENNAESAAAAAGLAAAPAIRTAAADWFAADEEDVRDYRGPGWTGLTAAAAAERSPAVSSADGVAADAAAAAAALSEDLLGYGGALGAAAAVADEPRATPAATAPGGSLLGAGRYGDGAKRGPRGSGVDRAALPEALAGTLDHIVAQLDMLTRTVGVLEQRLTLTEDRLQRGLAASPAASATSARGRG
eukprot:g6878.t1